MGEYLLYLDKVLFGGIYDNRLLLKETKGNAEFGLEEASPYDGAKPMYLIEDPDDVEKLKDIVIKTYEELKNSKR